MPRPTMPCRLRALTLLLGCALAAAGAAQAQNLLTLYEIARNDDATVRSARLQADAAVLKAEQSRALRRPTVSASGSIALSSSDTPWSTVLTSRSSQQTMGVQAQQPLFNRANERTIDQAERAIEAALSQINGVEQDFAVKLSQGYFDVLAAVDALDTVRASKAAIAEQLASAKRNFEVGNATITDTREAEARFDLARAQEIAAQNDLDTARLALDQIVGRSGNQPNALAAPISLPAVQPDNADEWVRLAEDASPTLRQLRLALEVAMLETAKARAGHLPTVALAGGLSDTHTSAHGTSRGASGPTAYGPLGGTGLAANVALQVNLPLFAGYAIENRIKETLVLEDKARSDLEAARRSITQGTRSAFAGVRSLQARVKALEAAEASSKLALEATQLGYQVGVRVNLDVLNAQTQLYTARRDLAKARYDALMASLKLRQVAGTLQLADLAAVNALLVR